MRLLYVPLDGAAIAKLTALAQRERRTPRDQAAYLLERALEQTVADEPPSAQCGKEDGEHAA